MTAELITSVAGLAAAAATLPGTIELALVTFGSWLPARPAPRPSAARLPRLAVVIPAHNEGETIRACLQSVRACHRFDELATLFVVADNCTDATATIARAAGADLIVRNNDTLRGKGHALHFAFTLLGQRSYFDAFLVVDADTEAAPNLIEEVAIAFHNGADAVQCAYLVSDPERFARFDLALRAFNLVRPKGRSRLGFSAGILGNGFAVSARTLARVPYTADSVVEDLEYHLRLVEQGIRVQFLESTTVRGAMPGTQTGRVTQRARWEGGRLRMLRERGAEIAGGWLFGNRALKEVLLELLTLPLAYHSILLLTALLIPSPIGRGLALAGAAVLFAHLLTAVGHGSSPRRDFATILSVPLYLLWKLRQIPATLRASSSRAAWVRTARSQAEAARA
jgi:cellulose synthase/poly-beta-1,6-N-acetylglucosamine synthase-like glycosyltransferase